MSHLKQTTEFETSPEPLTPTGPSHSPDLLAAEPPGDGQGTTRRTLLRTAGLVALAGGGAVGLAACGADETASPPATSAPQTPAAPSSAAPSSAAPSASASSSEPSATDAPSASGPSVSTADVPEGGGVILEDAKYVVTQPTKGQYKAFSSVCTHQGCPVASVSDGQIKCDCHGSAFSIMDGSVVKPPATKPLAEAKATVTGGMVVITA